MKSEALFYNSMYISDSYILIHKCIMVCWPKKFASFIRIWLETRNQDILTSLLIGAIEQFICEFGERGL